MSPTPSPTSSPAPVPGLSAAPTGPPPTTRQPPADRCLRFVRPMPGLDGLLAYRLDPLDPTGRDGVLFTLTSVDDPSVELLVAVPWAFFPEYAPEVDPEDAAAVGLSAAEDALVFVVLTAGATAAGSTANLLAPIVAHRESLSAAQVLLTGSDLPLRAPLAT